jgi:hypothetical protein
MERSTRTPLITLGAVWFAVAATGQQPQQPQQRNIVVIDEVVSTVNDAAILASTVERTAGGAIRARELELGRSLTEAETLKERLKVLAKLIDEHSMAQATKTLGVLPPGRVEEVVQERLKQATREQVRQLGSELRFTQELKAQGQSWPSWERDQRLKIMSELAEGIAVWGRLQYQQNLFITPRMMREFYHKNRLQFVHGFLSTVARIGFFVEGDREAVLAGARKAAELWRTESLTSTEMTARFPAARAQPDLIDIGPDTPPDRVPQYVLDFAANQAGTVSDPVAVGENSVFVMKVLDHHEATNASFEDPQVQAAIRHALEQGVIRRLRDEAIQRSRDRTYIWPSGK